MSPMLVPADPDLVPFQLSDQCVAVWQAFSVAHARREKIPSRLVLVLPPRDLKAEHRSGSNPWRERSTHVRFGSKADMCSAKGHFRFSPNSDHKSGHPISGSARPGHAGHRGAVCGHTSFVATVVRTVSAFGSHKHKHNWRIRPELLAIVFRTVVSHVSHGQVSEEGSLAMLATLSTTSLGADPNIPSLAALSCASRINSSSVIELNDPASPTSRRSIIRPKIRA
jgi:hypothetical protein